MAVNNMARKRAKKKVISKAKARLILKEGKIGGKKITKKQRGFFGARVAGLPVRRKKRKRA